MVATNDGFKIAEVDLEIRGPGDIMGTQQSGILNLRLADLARDGQLVSAARQAAREILTEDPLLQKNKHYLLREELKRHLKDRKSTRLNSSHVRISYAVFCLKKKKKKKKQKKN